MDQRPPELAEGDVVAGRYRITGLLGEGGMGAVYRATDANLDRPVALKVIKQEHAARHEFRSAFLKEGKRAAHIEHPNVVTVYDANEDNGLLFLVMRYVPGQDLGTHTECQGPMQWQEALKFLRHIASGLDAVHESGLVHADVKPANVLISGQQAFLTDFGIARESRVSPTLPSAPEGDYTWAEPPNSSPAFRPMRSAYMAQEQWLGLPIDHRVDIYALGAVFYTMLTGRLLYERDGTSSQGAHPLPPPSSLVPGLPVQLDAVVRKAMAKERDDRYQSGAELVGGATSVLADVDYTPPTRPRWLARTFAVVGLGAAVALAAVLQRSPGADQPTLPTVTVVPTNSTPRGSTQSQGVMETFRDDETKSSLNYPRDWRRVSPPRGDSNFRLLMDGGNGVAMSFRVSTTEVPITRANVESIRSVTDSIVAQDPTARILKHEQDEMNGMALQYYYYTFTSVSGDLGASAVYFLFKERTMNILVFSAPRERFEAMNATFTSIAQSFRRCVVPSVPSTSTTIAPRNPDDPQPLAVEAIEGAPLEVPLEEKLYLPGPVGTC